MIDTITKAPELRVNYWIDPNGNKMKDPIRLSSYKDKFKIIYCFQNWCPGCHSRGLPDLKKMVDALQDNDKVIFLAIQTVFEGFDQNTADKINEAQYKYDLKIPFGHDAGVDGKSMSTVLQDFKTGGTPWFLFLNERNDVMFSNFHLNSDAAIEFLQSLK